MPSGPKKMNKSEVASIFYHNIFDYPLTLSELEKWKVGKRVKLLRKKMPLVESKNGFYFLKQSASIIVRRKKRERASEKKLLIAKKAARVLSRIPSLKMIGVTGSLAMKNAGEDSDIDIIVITQKGTLWITRALSWLVLKIMGLEVRKPNDKRQKDKLCLNIWLDENDLAWEKRNIYTAHEICQIRPLLNRQGAYENFIEKNKWVFDFWPNAKASVYKKRNPKMKKNGRVFNLLCGFLEKPAFIFQKFYMAGKITTEVATPTRAVFHPRDFSKLIISKLKAVQPRSTP